MSKIESLESYLTNAFSNLGWANDSLRGARYSAESVSVDTDAVLGDIRNISIEDFSFCDIESALEDIEVTSDCADYLDEANNYLFHLETALHDIEMVLNGDDDDYEPRHARKEGDIESND